MDNLILFTGHITTTISGEEITASDPDLTKPEHTLLREQVDRVFTINQNTVS